MKSSHITVFYPNLLNEVLFVDRILQFVTKNSNIIFHFFQVLNSIFLLMLPYKKLIRIVMVNNFLFNQLHTNLWTIVSILRYLFIGKQLAVFQAQGHYQKLFL